MTQSHGTQYLNGSMVSDERLAEFINPRSQTRGPTMQECIDMARELQSFRSKPSVPTKKSNPLVFNTQDGYDSW